MVVTTQHVVGGVLLLSIEGGNVDWVDCYRGQPELQQSSSYSVDVTYHPTNGHPDNHSPLVSPVSAEWGCCNSCLSHTKTADYTAGKDVCACFLH